MADPVTCAECGVRYDPAVNAFCPRCGSTVRGATLPPALEAARRHDPSRRRVQASGTVLAVVGGLLVLLFLPVMFLSSGFTGQTIDDVASQQPEIPVPGGELHLTVLRAGTPASGLLVNVSTPAGTPIANGTTDASGRFNASLGDHAFVYATVVAPEGNFTRRAIALDGTSTDVSLDLATDPVESEHWAGLGPLLRVVRILLAVFLAVAAMLCAAGICAMRLRAWAFAVSGAAIGVIPALLLFVASLSLGVLLILLVMGVPLYFIARGRRHFKGRVAV